MMIRMVYFYPQEGGIYLKWQNLFKIIFYSC